MYPTEDLAVVGCTALIMAVKNIWVIGIRKPVIKFFNVCTKRYEK
jgi:hypothetical protein